MLRRRVPMATMRSLLTDAGATAAQADRIVAALEAAGLEPARVHRLAEPS